MPQTDRLPEHAPRLEGAPAPEGRVRVTRPLSLTANVVLRPSGPLDGECADELRAALDYVTAKPGGLVVVDCAEVTSVTTDGSSVLDWLEQGDHGDRNVEVRNPPSQDRSGARQPGR